MDMSGWHYFLSIEKDFIATTNFVELDLRNGTAFGNSFAKLLLLTGSEVDVVAKRLCGAVEPERAARNVCDYREILSARFVGIHEVTIEIPRYRRTVQPWLEWSEGESPEWWSAYNNVKHHRDTHFAKANQKNVLGALCGLLAINLYLYRDVPHLQPYPDLLNAGFPKALVTDGGTRDLPGV